MTGTGYIGNWASSASHGFLRLGGTVPTMLGTALTRLARQSLGDAS